MFYILLDLQSNKASNDASDDRKSSHSFLPPLYIFYTSFTFQSITCFLFESFYHQAFYILLDLKPNKANSANSDDKQSSRFLPQNITFIYEYISCLLLQSTNKFLIDIYTTGGRPTPSATTRSPRTSFYNISLYLQRFFTSLLL